MDLWLRQPATFMPEALAEGFRNFTWHIGIAMAKRIDPLVRIRAYALPYGESTKIMLIDFPGAIEYGMFSSYDAPLAVYPTWTPDEGMEKLEHLCKNPPGDMAKFYNDTSLPPVHRPVKGQKHRIVIHRILNGSVGARANVEMMLRVRDFEAEYDVEIFPSGFTNFDFLFSYNLSAADYRPVCMIKDAIYPQMELPTGKILYGDAIFDGRYKDWFELLGFDQVEMYSEYLKKNRRVLPTYAMRAAQWARRNWSKVEPFVIDRNTTRPPDADLSDRILRPASAFVLPATRRRVMRNLGLDIGELDRFACDACILHNTCKLYRANSVCTVKGAETVALADSFGTRNADVIINGLSKLLQRQAERLEDAMAAEDVAEPNPDVTRQINSVFANGVKLAKLIDPNLAGGPKVTVNVGVGAGGQASIVAQQDPRQITAQVVAEIEASGIPRDKITAEMLAAYLKAMNVEDPAAKKGVIGASKAISSKKKRADDISDERSPEEDLIPKDGLFGGFIEGEATVNGDAA